MTILMRFVPGIKRGVLRADTIGHYSEWNLYYRTLIKGKLALHFRNGYNMSDTQEVPQWIPNQAILGAFFFLDFYPNELDFGGFRLQTRINVISRS